MDPAVLAMSIIAAIFYAVSLGSSNGDEEETMQSYWAKSTYSNAGGVSDVYFGLKAFVLDSRSTLVCGTTDQFLPGDTTTTDWSDFGGDTFDGCTDNWESTIGLLSVALMMSLITIFCSLCHQINLLDFAALKWMCLGAAFLAALFGASGFGNWMDECYPDIKDFAEMEGNTDVDTFIGPGAAGGAIGWIFMVIVFFLQIFVASRSDDGPTLK